MDVNVHPAKTEVKFLSERGAFDAVHYAVLSALNKAPGRPAVQLPATKHDAIAQSLSSGGSASKQDAFRTMPADEFRRTASAPEVNPFSQTIRPAAKPVSVFVDEPSYLSAALASPVQVPARNAAPEKPPVPAAPTEPEEHIPVTLPLLREERPVEVCPSEKQAEPEPAQALPEAPAQQALSMQ